MSKRTNAAKKYKGAVLLQSVGTSQWQQAIPKHLAKPLKAALDASEKNEIGEALRWFGVCAELCKGIDDPDLKPVLYFGSQAASRAYFKLRGAAEIPQSQVDQWRFCAETLVRSCWEVSQGDPVAAHNLGRFLHDCDEWEQAVAMYRVALQLKPSQVESWGNLGTAYMNLGDPDAAKRCWMKCTAFPAENPSGALAQAYVHLRNGNYETGWKLWEHRWVDAEFGSGYGRKELTGKRWTGEDMKPNDKLFVHGEQGLGDHVMFARYVPLLLERGLPVVALETRPTLMRWMEKAIPGVPIVSRVTSDLGQPPEHTHQVSTMSLPAIFGTTIHTVPKPVAPLHLRRLGGRRMRVGLAWCGAIGNPSDTVRSVPDHLLAMLRGLDVDWVSVQFTPAAGMYARAWLGDDIEDATDTCKDVLDTAKVLMTCDLVLTVDTLTAHIAGSLGLPTIVLHRFDREWRWYEASPETTIWYPGMQQWTQSRPNAWEPLLERVRVLLAR